MQKFTNSSFIKQIIDLDFLFIDSIFNKSRTSLKEVKLLNLFETVENLKQFINILVFLKLKKKFSVYIWSDDKYFNELIVKFTKDFFLEDCIHVSKNFPVSKSREKNHSLLLIFGTPFLSRNKKFIRKIFSSNFFLIYKVNLQFDKYNTGVYKLKNGLTDYKKLIFMLIILYQILNKK